MLKRMTRRFHTVSVPAQHAHAVDQSPNHPRQKSGIARTDLARLLGFANGLLQNFEIPAAPCLGGAAGFEHGGEHHLELGSVFVRKAGIGQRHGVHLCRKTVSSVLSGRLHHIAELDKSGFADGEQQGGFILEVPVGGRPRNTQPLADLAQGERVNSLPLDQFESAFDQSGTEIPVMVPGFWLSSSHEIIFAQS